MSDQAQRATFDGRSAGPQGTGRPSPLAAPVPAIAARGLRARVGEGFALGPLSFEIPAGAYWGVVGPSGSGKTKLLELLAGLLPADAGELWFAGEPVTHLPPERRAVGFVYQDALLFPHLTVAENIAFAKPAPPGNGDASLVQLAEELALEPLLARRVGGLSGGERQRVALARALYRRPRVLLLDEPLSALDDALRAQTQQLLCELHRRHGLTVLQTAHGAADCAAAADVLRLRAGKLV